jgi:maleate cis-trans isomerase
LQGESEDIQNTIKEAVEKEEVLSDVKMNKKIDANPIKVKTPYPKEHKKSDVDFIGEELVKLSNRLNEIELSINDMSIQLKQVRSRMGLI